MIFFTELSKKSCTFLCKKQNLSMPKTANFTVVYFKNFLKWPIFLKIPNLRNFRFFFIFRLSWKPLKIFILKIQKVLSLWCYKL